MTKELKKQLFRFLLAGSLATLADFLVYMSLYPVIGYSPAKAASFAVGVSVAYLLNTFWTFERSSYSHKETLNFISLYAGIITINVGVNHLILSIFPEKVLLAFVGAAGVSMIINFIGQKWWVFKA